ncbi:MAG: transposase [Nitrosomonas sp.]|nr:transposase [Nitrosomonas sp.]
MKVSNQKALHWRLGYIPVAPPKINRLKPWEYDRTIYKKRNEIERLFRRLKRFRRIFFQCDKLDIIFLSFISLLSSRLLVVLIGLGTVLNASSAGLL